MVGVPLTTSSSSMKGSGSMPSPQEESNAAAVKYSGDSTWKSTKLKNRESPAPESGPMVSTSEEGKILQKLVRLRQRVCPGDYEKYIILVERDKLLCQLRECNSSLVFQLERCQEFCTEKERYRRIVQKEASPFECDKENGEVSHEMMVKQYARSAADQERPLPHELRSETCMNHTMSYLLHNILDEFPESSEQRAAWYSFLWSRTRALQKEVTQLSMADNLALNLVERCTRLHILFGYVLCDLETKHFDASMNNETIGKCLQTLRHLYEDFAKRGIPCDNEPEFRSYDVMFCMDDTNVLSQVLSYRSEVRQSHSVRLALQLAAAFRDKNYCRFFRLLKTQASFLQCCVSHKLFAAARSNAISVMTHSYGKTKFPLETLKNALAFDTTEDLVLMLNLYGLQTESGSNHVMLSKDDLSLGKAVPLHPYKWIDTKISGKFSQVVQGPGFFQFIASRSDVSNSFNHRNEYVHDKVLDAVLDGLNIPVTNASPKFSFAQSAGSLSLQAATEQKRKAEVKRLKKQEEAEREQLVRRLMNKIIDHVVRQEEITKASVERDQLQAMETAKKIKEEEERQQLEVESKRKLEEEDVARRIFEKMEKEAVERELSRVARIATDEERTEGEVQLTHRIMDKIWCDSIGCDVEHAVDMQRLSICEDIVNEKEAIMGSLKSFRNKMSKQWLMQFWDRWREWKSYATPPEKNVKSANFLLSRPSNSIRLAVFHKNRINRIGQKVVEKWKTFTKRKRSMRKMAEKKARREQEFFKRFEKKVRTETRFKFDAPKDPIKSKPSKSDSLLEKKPLKESQNSPPIAVNTSLLVARRQLEDWEPFAEIPIEKLRRKRESFEKAREEHLTKKRKDGELLSSEVKVSAKKIDVVSGKADSLLDETLKYTAELDEMMAEIRARRVADL